MEKKHLYLVAIGGALVLLITIRIILSSLQEDLYQVVLYVLLVVLISFLFFFSNKLNLFKVYAGILVLESILYLFFHEFLEPLVMAFPEWILGWNILLFLIFAARNIGILVLRPVMVIVLIGVTAWMFYQGYNLVTSKNFSSEKNQVESNEVPRPVKKNKAIWSGRKSLSLIKTKMFQPEGFSLSFSDPVKISYDRENWIILNPDQETTPTKPMYVDKLNRKTVVWYWRLPEKESEIKPKAKKNAVVTKKAYSEQMRQVREEKEAAKKTFEANKQTESQVKFKSDKRKRFNLDINIDDIKSAKKLPPLVLKKDKNTSKNEIKFVPAQKKARLYEEPIEVTKRVRFIEPSETKKDKILFVTMLPKVKQKEHQFSGTTLPDHKIRPIQIQKDIYLSFSEKAIISFDEKKWNTINPEEEIFCLDGRTLWVQNISQNPTMDIYKRY